MKVSDCITKTKTHFGNLTDARTGQNAQYDIADIVMAAYSVFHTQSPSFLHHQTLLKKRKGSHNGHTLFDYQKIPSDNHIRKVVDEISPQELSGLFDEFFEALDKDEWTVDGRLVIAFDGITFLSSSKINCQCCLKRQCGSTTRYFHAALCPVVIHPNQKAVFPLMPMFIQNEDGVEKQDCEINAAKRWIHENKDFLSKNKVIFLGDDLFSHAPMLELIQSIENVDAIFVAKPTSHTFLEEHLQKRHKSSIHTLKVSDKRYASHDHSYTYVNKVPISSSAKMQDISYFSMDVHNKKGRHLYKNSFVTTIEIDNSNIHKIACLGRNRWKIENEAFNTLSTKGYNFKHNYGHGKKNLANFLATLNILAFLIHTLCLLLDEVFRKVYESLSSRRQFFQLLNGIITFMVFDSWDHLMELMHESLV